MELLIWHCDYIIGRKSRQLLPSWSYGDAILHSLVMGTNINYAEVIYNELKMKVSERRINVPYTRFLSLVFQKTLGKNYTQTDLETITPPVNGPYFHKDVKKTDPKLTTAMRSMINNPYVLPQSDSEADSLDFKADSLDPEADSSDSEADSSPHCNSSSSSPSNSYNSTSSSQLSKSSSRNKFSIMKTRVEATADMDIDDHEPDLDFYLTPSPSHSHHSSPNTAQQDPSTHTSAILQAIMALTSKVDIISSNVESVKSCMATLQTQQDLLERELATLKAQNQNPAPSQNPSSPTFHSSVQGLTSQVSALESEMKAIHHTLQENSITSDAKLREYIDEIKTQHFCFSVQLENLKNLQEKVKAAEPAFSKVHTSARINNHVLGNLNDKVMISAKAATSKQPAQQSPSPSSYKGEYKAVSSDSKTRRSKRKRLKIQLRKNQLPRSHVRC
ncbi:hypothetical protein Tco_0748668 [Tanacetum coccineum]|uniref:Uncharacterized protein n=1 Tax=Tanacetum coccineum TaxID=301880 RepID=A0ABQ4YX24_9ASTR